MKEDDLKQRMTHKEKLGDVVQHLKNGVYLSCVADSAYGQAIIWASLRIAELESQTQSPERSGDKNREVFFSLGILRGYREAIAWGQDRIKQLELENENLSKTILAISKSSLLASPESDEEIHQRRRRERMLDDIAISCVRGFLVLDAEGKTYRQIGASARDRAEDICHGIDEHDAKH